MGRALRLFITNLGAVWGVNIMAVIGANSNYSFMFAENEEQSWGRAERHAGFQERRKHPDIFQRRLGAFGQLRGGGRELADVPPDAISFRAAPC